MQGQSLLFNVAQNQEVEVPPVFYAFGAPAPLALTIDAPTTSLTALGQRVFLRVTADYPGGIRRNVTYATAGTSYVSSNTDIVRVDAGGGVEAVRPGLAVMTVRNEGRAATLRFIVSAPTDQDRDGVPDLCERAEGLDPTDPTDGDADPDGDGLSNRVECQIGTRPLDRDSDNDGRSDGEEVAAGTNPLVPDGPLCGNGMLDPGEQCDSTLADSSCCTPACQFAPAEQACRPAAGECDLAEVCSGIGASCPADALVAAGVICRASLDTCDPAESCSGAAPACPADQSSCAARITGLSLALNMGNSPDALVTTSVASAQRASQVSVRSQTATTFTTRYAAVVGVDTSAGSGDTSEALSSDYTIVFDVTAPGGYVLFIDTTLSGALTTVDDGSGPAAADVSSVLGTQAGGTLQAGNLSSPDPGGGSLTSTTTDIPFLVRGNAALVASARIASVSNGMPVTHSLRFTWGASCRSIGGDTFGGDECAVRLGLPIDYPDETAGDYPGLGGRDPLADGHLVNVALLRLATTFASGVLTPLGLAIDAADNLYVSSPGDGRVYRVTPAGVATEFASGFVGPAGLAFDAGGNLYVANFGAVLGAPGSVVSKVSPAGIVSTFATGLGAPFGLAFDRQGDLFVSDLGTAAGGQTIYRIAPAGTVSTFVSGLGGPSGLAFDAAGNLYAGQFATSSVVRIDPSGAVVPFATGFAGPLGLAFGPTSDLFVANSGLGFFATTDQPVSRVRPGGSVVPFAAGFSGPAGVAFNSTGDLFVSNFGPGLGGGGTTVSVVPHDP